MITDQEIVDTLRDHCLVFAHRRLPRGHYRVDTKLLYPDGAAVSVFVERGNLTRPDGVALSDFGNTLAKLAEFQVNPRMPKSRLQGIEETVGALGVRLFNDRLVLELNDAGGIGEGIITLGQACVRASCMIFNRRSAQQKNLSEEVHTLIEASRLPYEGNYRFTVPSQNPIVVNYRVAGHTRKSSILTLGGNHAQANEIFRKWSDLDHFKVNDQFVTIFDERRGVERKEDLVRLERVSRVVSVSNRRAVEMLIAA